MGTPYKDGKVEGIAKDYYVSGKLKNETPYKDSKVEGIKKSYYESGKVEREATYKDDKKEGYEQIYTESGRLLMQILYNNFKPVSGVCGDGRALTNAELANWENMFDFPNCAVPR